jgi:hypothetical protein
MNRYCCDCGREKHPTIDKEAVVNALMTKSPDEQLGGTTQNLTPRNELSLFEFVVPIRPIRRADTSY